MRCRSCPEELLKPRGSLCCWTSCQRLARSLFITVEDLQFWLKPLQTVSLLLCLSGYSNPSHPDSIHCSIHDIHAIHKNQLLNWTPNQSQESLTPESLTGFSETLKTSVISGITTKTPSKEKQKTVSQKNATKLVGYFYSSYHSFPLGCYLVRCLCLGLTDSLRDASAKHFSFCSVKAREDVLPSIIDFFIFICLL